MYVRLLLLHRPHIATAQYSGSGGFSGRKDTFWSTGTIRWRLKHTPRGVVYIYKVHICNIHLNTMSEASLTLARLQVVQICR